SKLAQGRDAAKRVIEDNPELAEELEEKIMAAMKAADEAARAPKGKQTSFTAPAAPKDPAAVNADDLDFDDELPDDFSIDEDIDED
ncbi:MAG: hypothetical protein K2N91_08630, partial [Muribaculaceae bacterium]|nr:hypothetical protein [Muribaculaceae bacterium]